MTTTKNSLPSPSSLMGEYEKLNSFHSIKYFHRFINKNYDCRISYCPPLTEQKVHDITQYSKDKVLSYQFSMHNVESSILKSHFNTLQNRFQPTKDSNPYPLAVRFSDHEKGIYIVERPPFQVAIDYSMKKHMNRKEVPFLVDRKIWIPWTISLVNCEGRLAEGYNQKLFFSDKSVSSFEDVLYYPVLPNLFADSRICFGESILHVNQRIQSKELTNDISSLFPYFFNDYFSSWNADLSVHVRASYDILQSMNIFSRAKGIKRLPKYLMDLNAWLRNNSKFWASFLLFMSLLTYEETIEFYRQLGLIEKNNYHRSNHTTLGKILADQYLGSDDYSQDNLDAMVNNFNTRYDTWSQVLGYGLFDNIFESQINVKVQNIPSDKLLDQDFISNPNLSAYMYYACLKNYCQSISSFCTANNKYFPPSHQTITNIVRAENIHAMERFMPDPMNTSGDFAPHEIDHSFEILQGFKNSSYHKNVESLSIVVDYNDVILNKNFLA